MTAFEDAYRRVRAEMEAAEAREESEHSWRALGEWLDAVVPSQQDAPAIGYHVPDPVPGAAAVTSTASSWTPSGGANADPVADMVKAYHLVNDTPWLKPDRPGRDKWIKLSDVYTLDDAIEADHQLFMRQAEESVQRLAWEQLRQLEEHLRALPDGASWCVHGPEAMVEEQRLDVDGSTFTVCTRAHEVHAGETCTVAPRTVYGPMTPEIRAQADRPRP